MTAESSLPSSSTQRQPARERVIALVERAVKAASVFAVVGYMSLRAHLNQLGIPVATGMESSRFVEEFYVLFSDLLFRLEVYAILVGTVVLLTAVAWNRRALSGVRHRLSLRLKTVDSQTPSHTVPAAMLAILLGSLFVLLRAMTDLVSKNGGQPITLGRLRPVAELRGLGSQHFDALLLWVLASALMCWMGPKVWKPSSTAWTWQLCWAIVAILGLHLPVLYGSFVHDSRYAKVSWTSDAQELQCGLLVLQTTDNISIWTIHGGQGQIIVLSSKSDKTKLIVGEPVDVFETIDSVVERKLDVNLCPQSAK